jgi:hypothetical protein
MLPVVALAAAGLVVSALPALAGKDCECVLDGKRVKEGEVACIRLGSSGSYLARCEMEFNNTIWRKLQDGCPTTALDGKLTPFDATLLVPTRLN